MWRRELLPFSFDGLGAPSEVDYSLGEAAVLSLRSRGVALALDRAVGDSSRCVSRFALGDAVAFVLADIVGEAVAGGEAAGVLEAAPGLSVLPAVG